MKKTLLLMFAITVITLLSCGETSRDPLAYQDGEIYAEIVILKNGCRVVAALHIEESGDISMTLTAPESVAGTEIKRTDGEVSVTRGEISSLSRAYLAAAELFRLQGDVISSETAELDGMKLTKIRVSGNGETFEVYLSENNAPVRIASNALTVDVVWFQNE